MLMLQNVRISDAPWHLHDAAQGTIIDNRGRLVAVVLAKPVQISAAHSLSISQTLFPVPLIEELDPHTHANNQALIVAAPRLLAALKEAAYHLDRAGIPLKQEYYDLVNQASGPYSPNIQVSPATQARLDSSTAETASTNESAKKLTNSTGLATPE